MSLLLLPRPSTTLDFTWKYLREVFAGYHFQFEFITDRSIKFYRWTGPGKLLGEQPLSSLLDRCPPTFAAKGECLLTEFTPPCLLWSPKTSPVFPHACVGTTAWHSRLRNKQEEGFEISRDSNFWTKNWRCVSLHFCLLLWQDCLNLPSLKWCRTRGRPRSLALIPDKKVRDDVLRRRSSPV